MGGEQNAEVDLVMPVRVIHGHDLFSGLPVAIPGDIRNLLPSYRWRTDKSGAVRVLLPLTAIEVAEFL